MESRKKTSASVTLEMIKKNNTVNKFIDAANNYLGAVGYTEHGFRHVSLVASVAHNTLTHLGFKNPLPELAGVAGYLHDIGNAVNRNEHGQSGAFLAYQIMKDFAHQHTNLGLAPPY